MTHIAIVNYPISTELRSATITFYTEICIKPISYKSSHCLNQKYMFIYVICNIYLNAAWLFAPDGLSILETADLLGLSHTIISRVYIE